MAKGIISFRNFKYLVVTIASLHLYSEVKFVKAPSPCSVVGGYQCFRGTPVLCILRATGSSEMLVTTIQSELFMPKINVFSSSI
jgi:hypothetical protein